MPIRDRSVIERFAGLVVAIVWSNCVLGQEFLHPRILESTAGSVFSEESAEALPSTLLRHDAGLADWEVLPVSGRRQFAPELEETEEPVEVDDLEYLEAGAAWAPFDTLSLFAGLEGSKQPQDFGVNANFGSRWAANWGFPLLAEAGLGAQFGTSINYTENAVQVFERIGATSSRTQNFTTIGLFQRTETWRWGLAYDVLYESYYDQFLLGQWRGRVGYGLTERNEIGVWGTVPQQRADGSFGTIPVRLSPLAQCNAYWQHTFDAGACLMGWVGASEGHSESNLALGDLPETGPQFVFGAEVDIPLNDQFAIFGQANFIAPADTGTVDSFLGICYYPGARAYPACRSRFNPFQALANSTMFAVDLAR